MKILSYILLSFSFFIFIISCGTGTANDGSETAVDNGTNYNYFITNGGGSTEMNNLSDNPVDTNYDIFFFKENDEERKIYIGGNHSDYSEDQWGVKEKTGNKWDSEWGGIFDPFYNNNNIPYWSMGVNFENIPNAPDAAEYEDHEINIKKGHNNTDFEFIKVYDKDVKFRIAGSGSRSWDVDVYKQNSYYNNSDYETLCEQVEDIFEYDLHVNTELEHRYNSNMPDAVLNRRPSWETHIDVDDNPLLQYAFKRVRETEGWDYIPDDEDVAKNVLRRYIQEYRPNRGLLFFIKDYEVEPGYGNAEDIGVTFAGSGVTEIPGDNYICRKPNISFVWVDRVIQYANTDWHNKALRHVAAHELGHLYVQDFTDHTHTFWHNGDNRDICIMTKKLIWKNGEPDTGYKMDKILDKALFCEGHRQRGLNTSWVIGKEDQSVQYWPMGEKTVSKSSQSVFALNNSNTILNNIEDKVYSLHCNLEADKNIFIKDEKIYIYLYITNLNNEKIVLENYDILLHYTDIDRNLTYSQVFTGKHRIPANGKNIDCSLINIRSWPIRKKSDLKVKPTILLGYPGNYEIKVIASNEHRKDLDIISNTFKIKITEELPPQKDKEQYAEFYKNDYLKNSFTTADEYIDKISGNYYEQNILTGAFMHPDYHDVLRGRSTKFNKREIMELSKYYLLTFPNNYFTFSVFNDIYYSLDSPEFVQALYDSIKNIDIQKLGLKKNRLLERINIMIERGEWENLDIK